MIGYLQKYEDVKPFVLKDKWTIETSQIQVTQKTTLVFLYSAMAKDKKKGFQEFLNDSLLVVDKDSNTFIILTVQPLQFLSQR